MLPGSGRGDSIMKCTGQSRKSTQKKNRSVGSKRKHLNKISEPQSDIVASVK
jgi:hypothetical protein